MSLAPLTARLAARASELREGLAGGTVYFRTPDYDARLMEEAKEEIDRLWAEATRYVEALDCYGVHSDICVTHEGYGDCDCGFDAALATTEEV